MRPQILARRVAVTSDAGIYAVLYAMLMLAMFLIASLVVDLSMLRADRTTDRSIADSAVVAAGTVLIDDGPYAACQQGFSYAATNLDTALSPDCSGFPTSIASCPTSETSTSAVAGSVTVTFTWPVTDSDPIMTHPDVRPGDVTQSIDAADRGPCGRVKMSVGRPRQFSFGELAGISGGSTVSTSVALAYVKTNTGGTPSPLAVLDPHSCDALVVNGGSTLLVAHATQPDPATGDLAPGRIEVDSDGAGGDIACNGGAVTINSTNNGYIHAEDGQTATGSDLPATITSYALTMGASDAYNPSATAGCVPSETNVQGSLCPVPIPAGARVGQAPFNNRYNCLASNGCPYVTSATDTSKAYIQQFEAYAASNTLTPYSTCSVTGTVVITGNVEVNCPGGFKVTGTAIFTGTRVVFTGPVYTQSTGSCIVFGIANPPATDCPTLLNDVSSMTLSHPETLVYMPSYLSVPTTIIAPQTMLDVHGPFTVNGTAWLSGPYGTQAGQPACAGTPDQASFASCFQALVLWDDYATPPSSDDRLSGGGAFHVDGSLYMPNAQFVFNGTTAGEQTSAQFVAKRVEITGGGQLTMIPDWSRETLIPEYAAALIR